jgi:signal transduction histidine kinase
LGSNESINKDTILLEIQDDGVGLIKPAWIITEQRGSLGLKNMVNYRDGDGIFRLDSAVGKGTIIRVVIPLSEEAAEKLRRGG